MARTKNTPRKRTGGRVPRHQLASRTLPEQPHEEPVAQEEELAVQEEPHQEDQSEDEPMEEDTEEYHPADPVDSADEDPVFRAAQVFRSNGAEGGEFHTRLRGLLFRLGIHTEPEYHSKRVSRPERHEWRSTVSIYDEDRLLSTHEGPAFRSTREAAVADAAWAAVTSLSHTYRRSLEGTAIRHYPRRRSGTRELTGAAVEVFVSPLSMVHTKDTLLDVSRHLLEALEEIQSLRSQLADAQTTVLAHQRVRIGEASDLYSTGLRTWTATSPRRGPTGDDDASSHA